MYGAILAVTAIGLTLVYGILNISNFAHGDTLTFGAYMALFFGVSTYAVHAHLEAVAGVAALLAVGVAFADRRWTKRLTRMEAASLAGYGALVAAALSWVLLAGRGAGTSTQVLVLATLLSIAATCLLTVTTEFALWRPLRRRGAKVLSLVIASLGLALVLRNGIQEYFGGDYRSFDRPTDEAAALPLVGVRIAAAQWFTLAATLAIIALVHLFLTRTRVGKAMRALADNPDLARACGIDVDRVTVYVWILSGALVSIGGVLLALNANNNVNVNMGFAILIPIFASVVLGGVGSPYGAMLGGLVVGIAMKMGPREYDVATAFVVLLAVLLIRPQGILGRKA